MTIGRRSVALAAVFLGLVGVVARPSPTKAQIKSDAIPSTRQFHELWNPQPTPEEIRQALMGFKGGTTGLPPEAIEAIRKKIQLDHPGADQKMIEGVLNNYLNNPGFKQWADGLAEQMKKANQAKGGANPEKIDPKVLEGMLKNSPFGKDGTGTPSGKGGTLPEFKGGPQPKLPELGPKGDGRPSAKGGKQPTFPTPGKNGGGGGGNNDIDPPSLPGQGGTPSSNPLGDGNPLGGMNLPDSPNDKMRQAAASLWERNIGPLDDTPAVKRALFELVEGTSDITDAQGNSFWDMISKEAGDSTSFADWLKDASMGDSWKMPSFDFPSLNWGRSNIGGGGGGGSSSGSSWWSRQGSSSSPRGGSSGSGGFGSIGIPGLEGTWWPVVILAAILFGVLVWWRFWYLRDPRRAAPAFDAGGLGPWPVDPRRIATRQDLVLAFEYLSVLICGPSAKTWTHTTIAAALADLATTHAETALMLARLYELARYAPLDEPLTAEELEESRHLVCTLAGVSYA